MYIVYADVTPGAENSSLHLENRKLHDQDKKQTILFIHKL